MKPRYSGLLSKLITNCILIKFSLLITAIFLINVVSVKADDFYNNNVFLHNNATTKNSSLATTTVPTITSFSQNIARAGDDIIIYGYNFSADPYKNIVWIGGIEAIINDGSETELEVTVPFGTASLAEIVVLNTVTALKGSSILADIPDLKITFENGELTEDYTFIEDDFISPETTITYITNSDLNADGLTDIIFSIENEIGIAYRNTENSYFEEAIYLSVPYTFDKLIIRDIDNNGLNDIIGMEKESSEVSIIFRDNGNEGFSFQEDYSFLASPVDFQVHDMNLDGLDDIILTGSGQFAIAYRSPDNEGFLNPDFYGPGVSISHLSIADFNNDDFPDIAVTLEREDDNLQVFLQNSESNFILDQWYTTDIKPTEIISADLNNDDILDLVTVNISQNSITILEGYSDGSFSVLGNLTTPDIPYSLHAANLNGNSNTDLVLLSNFEERIIAFEGDGNFNFSVNSLATTGKDPNHISIGDFNHDGKVDIAVNNFAEDYIGLHYYLEPTININTVNPVQNSNNIKIEQTIRLSFNDNVDPTYINENSIAIRGSLSGSKTISDYAIEDTVVIIDPNALGDDFILGEKVSLTVTDLIRGENGEKLKSNGGTFYNVKTGLAPAEFVEDGTVNGAGTNEDFAVGDFNNDYLTDLVVLKSDRAFIYLNGGNGTFSYHSQIDLLNPTDLIVKDFNNDGYNDIAVSDDDDGTYIISIFLNDGTANFTEDFWIDLESFREAIKINSGDLNNDGFLDIVVAFDDIPEINIYQGETDGSFTYWDDISLGTTFIEQVEIADLNLDGLLDIVVTHGNTDDVEILIQSNDNSFFSSQLIPNNLILTNITGLSIN